jgi:hypothetical protein
MVPARGDEASRIARLAGRVDEPLGLTRDQIKIIEK